MKKIRLKSKHRYASEALIVSVHSSGVWFDRQQLERPNVAVSTRGIVHVSAPTARKLAQWILDNT